MKIFFLIKERVTREQAKDTGMALVLICMLIGMSTGRRYCFSTGIILLVVNMIQPTVYKPVAVIWICISYKIGTEISKILLTIIFFVLVTPIGIAKRILGYDSLQLKRWKKDSGTAFGVRDDMIKAVDLEKPY